MKEYDEMYSNDEFRYMIDRQPTGFGMMGPQHFGMMGPQHFGFPMFHRPHFHGGFFPFFPFFPFGFPFIFREFGEKR